ncbi:uncharacterized protein RCC_07058 [Ramularia collo-cygni]|uniref:Methyltransferase type 11 domain-containing protein n=1 Tax=Ramularia collo-cygni TaxID=112498 RepID=A0A2D3VBW9_9PEZI|nr:uncharacterized protein RCC_07058 [Ramularia collo-cygni]CZT21196.1 uncharacterized protein RCC_07058 [Ramularia collo-cygni]
MSTRSNGTETLAQTNRKYWDAASEDTQQAAWVNDLYAQIGTFLMDPESSSWLGLPPPGEPQQKMLDYACGIGLPSRCLKPHFKLCVGMDVSAGMLAKYKNTASSLGLGTDEMLAVRGDLTAEPVETTDPPLPEEKLRNFDLIAICMALHHMEDIQRTITKLVERLRPGGTMLVIDWAQINGATPAQKKLIKDVESGRVSIQDTKHNGHGHQHQHHSKQGDHQFMDPNDPSKPHPASHTISHENFSEEQILELFEKAGCTEGRFKLAEELLEIPGSRVGKMQLFWARATKI